MTNCVRHHAKPVQATTGYLCDHHHNLLRGWLADVEDWYLHHRVFRPTALTMAVTDKRGGNEWGERGTGELQRDKPARTLAFYRHLNPLSGQLESNGADVPDVPALIDTWAQVLVEDRNEENGNEAMVVPESFAARIALLRVNVLWIEAQPWIDEFMNDLRACQAALAKVVGDATGPRPIGPCLNCGTNVYSDNELETWASRREHRDPAYLRRDKDGNDLADVPDQARCKACGESWTGPALIRFLLAQETG